jgi:hypothetical protein
MRIRKIISIPILILALLVILEATCLILNSQNNKYFMTDSRNSSKIVFNTAVLNRYYKGLTSTPYNYVTAFAKEKSKKSFRVFLIGESSLSGWPYSTNQSIQKKIENITSGYQTDKKLELITISFAGFNSSILVDLIPQVINYEPDLIIIHSGHNEFYGSKGYTQLIGKSEVSFIETAENVLIKTGLMKLISYDSLVDDLELILPLNSAKSMLELNQKPYNKIEAQYLSNISEIITCCKKNKISVVISSLPDNYLIPPVGITNENGNTDADIIYNNARMALTRDGDQNLAAELFQKAKDLDAFRLRIPEEFSEKTLELTTKENVEFIDLKSLFISRSKSCIPGNNLFADYIHPNINGLNVMAETYAQIIMKVSQKNLITGRENTTRVQPIADSTSTTQNDLSIANKRVERSLKLLARVNYVQPTKENVQIVNE